MKKLILTLSIAITCYLSSFAQWQNGTNIYNTNSGFVSIGTTNPHIRFQVTNFPEDVQNSLFTTNDYISGTTGSRFLLNFGAASGNTYTQLDATSSGGSVGNNLILNPSGGNVGIGTTSPGAKLEITTGGGGMASDGLKIFHSANSGFNVFNIHSEYGNGGGGNLLNISNFDNTKFLIDNKGNVGIGTTNPQEALSVNGNIRSREVKVETANWPDYVFKPDYKLPSLDEIKTYIDKNQHLPEMPSEQEVAKNGINLGEIVKIQTKKIEELTLYLIEQKEASDKQNKLQQDQINQLKEQLATLIKANK